MKKWVITLLTFLTGVFLTYLIVSPFAICYKCIGCPCELTTFYVLSLVGLLVSTLVAILIKKRLD